MKKVQNISIKHLTFKIGSYFGDHFECELSDNLLSGFYGYFPIAPEEGLKTIELSKEQLEKLNTLILKLDIASWHKGYECPDIIDGTSWEVISVFGNGNKYKSEGYNFYPSPDDFKGVEDDSLVSELQSELMLLLEIKQSDI